MTVAPLGLNNGVMQPFVECRAVQKTALRIVRGKVSDRVVAEPALNELINPRTQRVADAR